MEQLRAGENVENKQSNKKRVIIILLILLFIFLILMCFWLFSRKMYEVTFDSDGGTEIASVKVKENDKVEKPDDPTKDGYLFAGWYYLDELYDFETPVKQDMILKAKWTELIELEGMSLNTTELTLAPDGAAVLIPILQPENANNVELIWTSSDESIATVDENGNVKAIKEGIVTITVKTADGKYIASCTVKVSKETVKVEGVTISGSKEVNVGGTIKLTAKVTPDNATNKDVSWSSSNPSVARVDQNGNVTGLKAGKVTITVTTADGGHKATYDITVNATSNNTNSSSSNKSSSSQPQKPTTVHVTNVSISGASQVKVGQSIQLTANVSPSNATNKSVSWSSSNSGVATVDSNGRVTGKSDGTVTITVTTADGGHKATHTVTVSSTYVITFTKIQKTTGTFQYTINVTRNGQSFTGYSGIVYNGIPSPYRTGQYIEATEIDESIKTAQITVNGVKITATVNYR